MSNGATFDQVKQLHMDYMSIFETEAGKRVMANLQAVGFHKKPTFNENDRLHAYQEGMRAVLLHIETMVTMDLEKMEEQMKQQQEGA
jgi:hypothetical protein